MKFYKAINESIIDKNTMNLVREAISKLRERKYKFPSFNEVFKYVKENNPSLKTLFDQEVSENDFLTKEQKEIKLRKLKDAYADIKSDKGK